MTPKAQIYAALKKALTKFQKLKMSNKKILL